MWLVVGLGNPGQRYAMTRHNIGFMVADALAETLGASAARTRFQGLCMDANLQGEKVLLLKPQTFMNLSGRSVAEAAGFYQIPLDRILVVHDELDLPFGRVRLKRDGGAAGHNGLRSLIEVLGNNAFARLRMGIGRPEGRVPVVDFVLSPFGPDERAMLPSLVEGGVRAVQSVLTTGMSTTMQEVNAVDRVPGTFVQA